MRTAWAAFWWIRWAGGADRAPKASSRNVTPTPSAPPISSSVCGVQGFPFTIQAKSARRTEITRPILRQPGDGTIEELLAIAGEQVGPFGPPAEASPELGQHLAGMIAIEEVDDGEILALAQLDLELRQEPVQGHREVVRTGSGPEPPSLLSGNRRAATSHGDRMTVVALTACRARALGAAHSLTRSGC